VYYASLERSATTRPDSGNEASVASAKDQVDKDKADVVQSLQALMNILQAVPTVTALMASRPALAPLLNCIEPICRFAALQPLNDALPAAAQSRLPSAYGSTVLLAMLLVCNVGCDVMIACLL